MKKLRTRGRIDVLRNQQRASPLQWGRAIYFGVLLGLVVAGLNWAAGDTVILRADALVTADKTVVAAVYTARIAKIHVKEGQFVKAGDVLAELESPDMLRDLAQMTAQNAELAARALQQRTRAATLSAVRPLAERAARESTAAVDKLDLAGPAGLVSSQRLDQALGTRYETAFRLVESRAEMETLATELPRLTAARAQADDTLTRLRRFYNDGRIHALSSGTVGAHVPSPGQVVRPGDELLRIHGQKLGVLAYLPGAYLFALSPGDKVSVSGGRESVDGTVEALLPVTDALPPEFQTSFRPRDRGRLARIRLTGTNDFVVSQKVRVWGCGFGWCWRSGEGQLPHDLAETGAPAKGMGG